MMTMDYNLPDENLLDSIPCLGLDSLNDLDRDEIVNLLLGLASVVLFCKNTIHYAQHFVSTHQLIHSDDLSIYNASNNMLMFSISVEHQFHEAHAIAAAIESGDSDTVIALMTGDHGPFEFFNLASATTEIVKKLQFIEQAIRQFSMLRDLQTLNPAAMEIANQSKQITRRLESLSTVAPTAKYVH